MDAESGARANAALLEAQSLDIKALNSADYPEILEFRFQQETLDKIQAGADKLPQIINVGPPNENTINFMDVARQMLGVKDTPLYTPEAMKSIRDKRNDIWERIKKRAREIETIEKQEGSVGFEGGDV